MPEINISNSSGRDAVIATSSVASRKQIRWVDAQSRQASGVRFIKSTMDHELDGLVAASGDLAAVSVAQYLPTLYVGEGRFSTVTTEAVTLASGGQRSLVAAYAWLQWLIPVLGFSLAAWLGKPRRFAAG